MNGRLSSAAVFLLASGSGTRMGLNTPKQLYELEGKTLVQRAVETYRDAKLIVVTHHPDHESAIRAAVEAANPRADVVMLRGGVTRRSSIVNALTAVDPNQWADYDLVVLQNAASPNTPTELVERCLVAAEQTGASQAYIPCNHTVVRLVGDSIADVVSRDRLGHTADPTVYRIGVLRRALTEGSEPAGEMTLDLVRQQNVVVTAVLSPSTNIKVTVPLDLATLSNLAQEQGHSTQEDPEATSGTAEPR